MNQITFHIHDQGRPLLPVSLHSVCGNYLQEFLQRPQGSDFHQILLVVQGEGILECQGQTIPLKRGSAFYTAPQIPVSYYSTNGMVVAFLTAIGTGLEQLIAHYHCNGFLFRNLSDPDKALTDIKAIVDAYYSYARDGTLSIMVYDFYVRFFDQEKKDLTPCEQAALFIQKNFAKKLTLEQIAQAQGISVSKLCHDFKKTFGCSVFSYILEFRLSYAHSFLQSNPHAKTKDVALSCGFEDSSYFCKSYKTRFGHRPSEDKI